VEGQTIVTVGAALIAALAVLTIAMHAKRKYQTRLQVGVLPTTMANTPDVVVAVPIINQAAKTEQLEHGGEDDLDAAESQKDDRDSGVEGTLLAAKDEAIEIRPVEPASISSSTDSLMRFLDFFHLAAVLGAGCWSWCWSWCRSRSRSRCRC